MKVISSPSEVTLKIRRSTFIGFVAPCNTPDEAKQILADRCQEHSRATHNCWAYITGFDGSGFHFSDAGEPGGSAGRPMYNALRSSDLTNVVAVVTRYYGGVKLGVRGLMEAYAQAVEEAVDGCRLLELVKSWEYNVSLSYPLLNTFNHVVSAMGSEEISSQYDERVHLILKIPDAVKEEFESYLVTLRDSQGLTFEELGESK